jgi:hypothetical protein
MICAKRIENWELANQEIVKWLKELNMKSGHVPGIGRCSGQESPRSV